MAWEVEYTDEFGAWWDELDGATRKSIEASVGLLEEEGPHLGFPHTSGVIGSRHGNLRELRAQHAGEPYRVFYAFDPRRTAILLIAGNKKGRDGRRFYAAMIPKADALYDAHLETLERGFDLMAKKFRDLVNATMSPADIEEAHERTMVMLREYRLVELRRARSLSQQELADRLSIKQPKVSEMERRANMYVSTLRKYIEAVGGELVIVARFPEGDIRIQQFDDLGEPHGHGSKRVTA